VTGCVNIFYDETIFPILQRETKTKTGYCVAAGIYKVRWWVELKREKAHLSHSGFQWSLPYRCRYSYSAGLHTYLHSNMAWVHIH